MGTVILPVPVKYESLIDPCVHFANPSLTLLLLCKHLESWPPVLLSQLQTQKTQDLVDMADFSAATAM